MALLSLPSAHVAFILAGAAVHLTAPSSQCKPDLDPVKPFQGSLVAFLLHDYYYYHYYSCLNVYIYIYNYIYI